MSWTKTKPRICIKCGKLDQIRFDSKSIQCKSCAAAASGAKSKLNYKKIGGNVPCHNCGISFYKMPSAVRQNNYCSYECKINKFISMRVDRVCIFCEKKFNVHKSVLSCKTNSSANYCSRDCYNKFMGSDRIDNRYYGYDFKLIRSHLLQIYKHCFNCGTFKNLEIHHLIPFRLTHDNSYDNLIVACKSCHKKVEYATSPLFRKGFDLEISKILIRNMFDDRYNLTRIIMKQILRTK